MKYKYHNIYKFVTDFVIFFGMFISAKIITINKLHTYTKTINWNCHLVKPCWNQCKTPAFWIIIALNLGIVIWLLFIHYQQTTVETISLIRMFLAFSISGSPWNWTLSINHVVSMTTIAFHLSGHVAPNSKQTHQEC